MTRIFAEAHRVLVDDGLLTVMFSHKEAGGVGHSRSIFDREWISDWHVLAGA